MKLKLKPTSGPQKRPKHHPDLTLDLAKEGAARMGYHVQSTTYDRHAIYYHPNAINQPQSVPAPDRADAWTRSKHNEKSERSLSQLKLLKERREMFLIEQGIVV